ncbi:MAG: hypothetical protein WD627_03270 [Actinomycetota bacterium]
MIRLSRRAAGPPVQTASVGPAAERSFHRAPGAPAGAPAALGPALLSAAIGVQLMLASMLLLKPPGRSVAELSLWGERAFYPEHDVAVYVAGIAASLLLAWLLAGAGGRRGGAQASGFGAHPGFAILQAAVALGSTAVFLESLMRARIYALNGLEVPGRYRALFAATAFLCLAVAAAGRRGLRGAEPADRAEPGAQAEPAALEADDGEAMAAGQRPTAWDLIVAVAIVALVYVPDWRRASGRVFMEEGMIHWDLFAMAPSLAFHHGQALGSEFLSNYGAGWPMVFSLLSGWAPFSYGRMIQIGSIYLCLYFAGLYLLLRLLTGRVLVAAAGTGLAVATMFVAPFGLYLWRAPNATAMRWAFDVWCFIAVLLWWRSEKRVWLLATGGLVGLAVVFNIRSGIELAAAFAFYCLCTLRLRRGRTGHGSDAAAAAAGALVVALIGLALAGRGQIFSVGFWTGWLEEPLYFLTLPLATFPVPATLFRFAVVSLFYLTVTGYCLARLALRRARHIDVFNGFLAFYGLLVLIKFVHYSGDMTFVRLLTPAVIVAASLGAGALTRFEQWARRRWRESKRRRVVLRAPYALAGVAVLTLIAAPRSLLVDPVLAYPSLLSDGLNVSQPGGVCLMLEPRDICGLPAGMEGPALQFRAISERLRRLDAGGQPVAVLGETGSLFYLAGGIAPHGRYSRIFISSYTKDLQQNVEQGLVRNPPDYILTRTALQPGTSEYDQWAVFGPGPTPDSLYPDTWNRLKAILQRDYRLEASMAPFELWRLGREATAGSPP